MTCKGDIASGLRILKCTGQETDVKYSQASTGAPGTQKAKGIFSIALEQTIRQEVDGYSERNSHYDVSYKKGLFSIGQNPDLIQVWGKDTKTGQEREYLVNGTSQHMFIRPSQCVFK